MSATSKYSLSFREEASYGTDPGTGAALRELSYTSCGLEPRRSYEQSQQITANRAARDQIRSEDRPGGPITGELLYSGNLNRIISASLMYDSAASSVATITATTISFSSDTNTIDDSGSGFGSFAAGDLICCRGSSANGNFYAKIVTASAGSLLISGIKLTSETAGASIYIKRAPRQSAGSTLRSVKFEGVPTDIANVFEVNDGSAIESFGINIPTSGAITWSAEVISKRRRILTVTSGTGTNNADSGNAVMNSTTSFYGVLMGGQEGVTTSIASTSNAATTVITTATDHHLQTGDCILIAGNSQSVLNRNFTVTRISDTSFSVVPASTPSATTGSGTFRRIKVRKAVVSATMNWQNGLYEDREAGVEGPTTLGVGLLEAGGQLNVYQSDASDQLRFDNDEYTGLLFIIHDAADPTLFLGFEFPRVKLTAAPAPISGNSQSRVQTLTWAASYDSTDARLMQYAA